MTNERGIWVTTAVGATINNVLLIEGRHDSVVAFADVVFGNRVVMSLESVRESSALSVFWRSQIEEQIGNHLVLND